MCHCESSNLEDEAIPLGFENSVEIAAARRLGEPRNDIIFLICLRL